MDESAVRRVVSHMARSLVRNGRPQDLLVALSEASPKVADSHLKICYLDRDTAAKALVLCDRRTDETLIEEYLFGDADAALGNFKKLIGDLIRLAPSK